MHARVRSVLDGHRPRIATLLAAVVLLPVLALGAQPAGADTVAVALDCGPFDGTSFPIQDVTVAQGDTIEVTWDSECIHPTLDETVIRTGTAVTDAYFSSVPGQDAGVTSGVYEAIVAGSSSGTWVVRYDAPLGQMPLNTGMEDSWPVVCSNCATGVAMRLTITPGPSVPSAPAAPTVTPGDGSVEVSWSAPTDDGGSPVTGYTVTASPGGATCTATAPATSCTIEGLTNGQGYTFTVVATNVVGDGPASESSATISPAAAADPTTTTTAPDTQPAAQGDTQPISFVG